MANKLLTDRLSVPFGGATAADIDIDCGSGDLTIDELAGGEPVLAAGALQHYEEQGAPAQSGSAERGRTTLTLRAGRTGRPWFRLPGRPAPAPLSGGSTSTRRSLPTSTPTATAATCGSRQPEDLVA